MRLKVVLLTRSGRPSGALMAYRLIHAGYDPLILVEKRSAMLMRRKKKPAANQESHHFKKHDEESGNHSESLFKKHGFDFLRRRLMELLLIKAHYWARRMMGRRFKSPAFLSIEELALAYPLRLTEVSTHNSAEARALLNEEKPDVGILTNTRKITEVILASAKHGFFNIHSSSLPKYAGLDAIFWALYHGEKEIGVTVHEATPEIDRGRIAGQAVFSVTEWDSEASLARKASWVGTALMTEVLEKLETGLLTFAETSLEGGSYFSWPTREQRRELKNRVRSSKFEVRRVNKVGQRDKESRDLSGSSNSKLPTSNFKILHIITRMTRGGAQENTLATLRGLREKGYHPVLVTGPSWGSEGEILSKVLREGYEVVLLPELGREVDVVKDFLAFVKLYGLIRCGRFQLIHTHMSKGGLIGRLAAFLARAPVIVHTPHGHIFHSYFSRATERFFLFLERRLARITDQLIALTDSERREHVDFYVGERAQWSVIPSGVDESQFQPLSPGGKLELRTKLGIPPGAMVAGYIGRLEPIKGPLYFLQAIPAILRKTPRTIFLLIGGGQEREMLESLAGTLGVAASVRFTGDQRKVADFSSLLDVQVVPSLNEGMGRVIVEAGFLEKAVVATAVGGIPDLILHGKTGLLVPVRDSTAIADAVVQILEDTLLAEKLGRRLKEHIMNEFTEKKMVEKIAALYQRVLVQTPAAISAAV